MSAQVSFSPAEREHTSPSLTLVPPLRSTVSTIGFALIVMALVALGMGLVMVVTTTVAAQSKELSELRTESVELDYRAAALTTKLQSSSSTAFLALRASDLGMVPNPYPAFIRLSDGAILGEPTQVSGSEAPYIRRIPPNADAAPLVAGGAGEAEQVLPVAQGADR